MQSLNETSSSSSSCHATPIPTTTTTTASHRKRKHVELSVNFAKGEIDTQTPHEVQSSDDNNQETDTTIPRSLARNNGRNNHDSNQAVEESSEESEDLFRADSEDDNGDNKSDDDEEEEEEEKAPVFDAKKFFQTPRFRPKEMIEIKKRIKVALEKPMKRLEEGGKEVYLEYLRQKWKRSADATNVNLEQRKARLQQQIMDATIQGDPRGYQQTLFEIAKEKNTIINLGTGYGKTFIALLCIRHFSKAFEEGKQCLFLVPSVALAIQQSMTLRANLPNYSVQTACYASSNSAKARKILATSNVIVATHGAIMDLLMHYADIFQMSRFNLLVIDECHYATGSHSYAEIMKKFYHALPKDMRPHVLGLTASPLVNVKQSHSEEQLSMMLEKLETTLDATLAPVANLISEYNSSLLVKSATERVVKYKGTNFGKDIPSADNLDLHGSRYREFRQLSHLYKELGPLVVTLYCKTLIRELSRNEFESETMQQFNRAVKHLMHVASFCEQECSSKINCGRTDKLLALEELLEGEFEEQGEDDTVGLVFVERRITAMALHNYFLWRNEQIDAGRLERARILRKKEAVDVVPKVDISEDGMESQFDDSADDPFIAFQQTSIDDCSNEICAKDYESYEKRQRSLESLEMRDQFMDADNDENLAGIQTNEQSRIKTIVLVRNSTQLFRSLCIGRKITNVEERDDLLATWIHKDTKVRDVLTKLRRGEVNLLIATSVVEEGVDVQACSFVTVFDSLKNTKGYIQMKGRARKKNSRFYVFQDVHDDGGSSLTLSSAQEMERRVHDMIESKSMSTTQGEDQPRSRKRTKIEILPAELAALESGYFKVKYGSVDLHSAKSLLNRYALSVPLDPFARTSKEALLAHMPIFDLDRLILPSHLPRKMRVVSLPEEYCDVPKKDRQKMLSLMACVRLHTFKLLSDRLLPLSRSDMHEHILRVATKRLPQIKQSSLILDKLHSDKSSRVYVYSLDQSSSAFTRFENVMKGKGHKLAVVTFEPLTIKIPTFKMKHSEMGVITFSFGEPWHTECSQEQRELLSRIFILLLNERWRRRSRNMFFRMRKPEEYSGCILPYLVGILDDKGNFDWELMTNLLQESERSKEERTEVVRRARTDSPLKEPRLWNPIYDETVSYIVFGPSGEDCSAPFPGEKEDVETYQDYFRKFRNFDVSEDSPLFDVQRMWSLPSNIPIVDDETHSPPLKTTEGKYEVCKELASVKLVQTACLEAPLANTHVALLCCMLPQILFLFERYLKTKAFIDHCSLNLPILGDAISKLPAERVATAMTSKSCNPGDCYDKLEWFGDAVLKIAQTDAILKSVELREWIPFLHEGDLSTLRSAMGNNDRLEKVCKQLQLHQFVMSAPLARGRWIPSLMDFTEGSEVNTNILGTKIFADVLESILGLVYLEFGYTIAMKVADEIGVTLPTEDYNAPKEFEHEPKVALLDQVRLCTGYEGFKENPELVEEAFTHPSANHSTVSSYQRLEWIGDAALCLAMREWIFKNFPEISLGDMVVFEAALVSNETLAFLSMKNGLQHNLNHNDYSIPSRIESYSSAVRELGCGLWGADPPKAISDVVESILGAVHVDGGFFAGQAAALKLMSPVLQILVASRDNHEEIHLKHPKKILQEMAGEVLELGTTFEPDFSKSNATVEVLFRDNKWGKAHAEGNNYVGTIEMLGSVVAAVSEPSPTVGRNKVCALVVNTLQEDAELNSKFQSCRTKVESGQPHSQIKVINIMDEGSF